MLLWRHEPRPLLMTASDRGRVYLRLHLWHRHVFGSPHLLLDVQNTGTSPAPDRHLDIVTRIVEGHFKLNFLNATRWNMDAVYQGAGQPTRTRSRART